MTATKYTFICEQGANFNHVVTWKNAEGEPIDNTDYTARMQVRKDPGFEPEIELTTENNQIELGGANGEVQLQLLSADTAALVPGDYLYDLELVTGAGEISRIVEGVFSVNGEITIT